MFVMNLSSVVSHQHCFNESIDSESSVVVRCSAIYLWELIMIVKMSMMCNEE